MLKRQISKTKPARPLSTAASPLTGNAEKPKTNSGRRMMVFLFCFAFALYSQTLFYGYTLDDALVITENIFTKQGLNGVDDIMTTDGFTGFFGIQKKLVAGGRYRPLSLVIFALQYQFFGLSPFIGHLTNILMYALTGLLLFILLRRLIPDHHSPCWYRSLPFIATLLFLAHPLHTEVVANIKGLDEILSLFFSLLACHFALRYATNKGYFNLAWLFVSLFLALLSKENAITFLIVIPLILFFFRKPSTGDYLLIAGSMSAATLVYLMLRYNALGYLTSTEKAWEVLNDPYLGATATQRWATNIYTWGRYVWLLVFPYPLTHDYYPWHLSLTGWGNPAVILSLLITLFILGWAVISLRKRNISGFAVWFALITFSISSNIILNIGTFMNERFMFVPLLGFTMLIASWLLMRKKQSAGYRLEKNMAIGIVAGLCIIYSVRTIARNTAWKDDFTLFTTDVRTSSNSTKCNVSAGGVLLDKARVEENPALREEYLARAASHLQKALELYPRNSAGWVLLGNVFLERGDLLSARNHYVQCLNVNNSQQEALSRLANTAYRLGEKGNYEAGIEAYKALIRFQPIEKDYLIQLADQLSKSNRADTALIILKSLIDEDPKYAKAISKTGEIYGRVYQNIDIAEQYLLKAYSLDDKDESTLENLGIVNGIKKNFPLSIEFLNKALARDSSSSRVYNNLASTYFMMGDQQKAAFYRNLAQQAELKEKEKDQNKP